MSEIDRLKTCQSKKAFASLEAATAGGQRGYKCPTCHFYHRTGEVLPLANPVLGPDFVLNQEPTA